MRVKYIFSSRLTGKTRKPATTNKHSVAFTKMVADIIERADIILEVLDARFIAKTRNLALEKDIETKGKKLIRVLNKADLVNVGDVKFLEELEPLKPYAFFSSKSRVGRSRLREMILIEAAKIKFPIVRVGVIGYPNTGKSSLINALCASRRASTSPQSGHTKHIQEIKFRKNIVILDSPGVLTGEEENTVNAKIAARHSEVGAQDYTKVKDPDMILHEIMQKNPTVFDTYYKVESGGDVEVLLEKLGRRWNYLKKKNEVQIDRVARRILKDWQEGKISASVHADH